jgi:hypothetical protein
MDYSRDEEVDNHIITAYHFNIVKTAVHQLHIDADLTVAKYDVEQRDSLGPADTYHRYYSYTLTVNDQNQILSGKWDDSSDNPDFMWVALGAANHCGGANPAIPAANVLNILKALPEATARAIPLNQKVSAVIAPQDQVPVTSFLIASGDHLKLKFTVQQVSVQAASSKNQLMLIVSGDSRYPVSGGTEESMFIPIVPGTTVANLDRLVSIHSAAIVNQSQIATYSINAAFSELDYVGK